MKDIKVKDIQDTVAEYREQTEKETDAMEKLLLVVKQNALLKLIIDFA